MQRPETLTTFSNRQQIPPSSYYPNQNTEFHTPYPALLSNETQWGEQLQQEVQLYEQRLCMLQSRLQMVKSFDSSTNSLQNTSEKIGHRSTRI